MDHGDSISGAEPVERFDPTSGYVVGYGTLVVAAAFVVYIAVTDHTVTGLRAGLGAVFLAALVWATQLRPRAVAYRDTLLLKNIVGDTEIPLVLVDNVVMATTLNVYVDEQRYVCVGLGTKRKGRQKPRGDMFGLVPEAAPERGHEHVAALSPESYVPRRIQELAEEARKRGTEPGVVRRRTSLPVVALLVVSGLAFVVSLFL